MAAVCLVLLLVALCSGQLQATPASDAMKCPDGWLLNLASCYRRGTSALSFSQARAQCEAWGSGLRVIKNENENELFKVSSNGDYYWLGITKINSEWMYMKDNEYKSITFKPFQQGYYNNREDCIVWHSSENTWEPVRCHGSSRLFICQQEPECNCGRFGVNCSEECHCKGKPCNTTTGICSQGCQFGWTGMSCSKEKLRAEAKFYCFKTKNEKVMMFRVSQRGTKYRSVTAYDHENNEVTGCDKSHFTHFESGGLATLEVALQKNGRFHPSCGEQQTPDNRVRWKFMFKEFPMTSSAYDTLFEITCDFNNAETLSRLVTSNTEKSSNKTTTLTESKVMVSFDIIDPFGDQPLTTVKLGQQVKLQMKLRNGDGFGITAISPYNCSVSTLDGMHTYIFRDEYGCEPEDPQIVFHNSNLDYWQSEIFEAFSFKGYDKVNFRCDFHVCFSEKHDFCRNTCIQSKKRKSRKFRKRRRSKKHHQKNEENPGLGTTISFET